MKRPIKNRRTVLALTTVLGLGLAGCSAAAGSAGSETSRAAANADTGTKAVLQSIAPEDARAKLAEGGVTLVDVRTADEYAESHIEGAILLPNEEIGDSQPAALPAADAEIIVYCRTGRRSAEAAKKLAALGYTNLYDLGGIESWPYETVSGAWAEQAGEVVSAP